MPSFKETYKMFVPPEPTHPIHPIHPIHPTQEEDTTTRRVIIMDMRGVKGHLLPTRKKPQSSEQEQQRSKRIITETKQWNFTKDEITYENQYRLLENLHTTTGTPTPTRDKSNSTIILSQIKNKLRSYKEQDSKKTIYDPLKFVSLPFVLDKLKTCNMKCFYCNRFVHLLYEYVREPTQWTIERIDNKFGHNCDNVEIACLTCNLRRRTMYYERYLTTKQLCKKIVKVGGEGEKEKREGAGATPP